MESSEPLLNLGFSKYEITAYLTLIYARQSLPECHTPRNTQGIRGSLALIEERAVMGIVIRMY